MPLPARRPQSPRGERARRPGHVLLAAPLALATFVASCDRAAAPAPAAWPPGTVLVLDGEPISASDVDRIADIFALIQPQDSQTQTRRLALTNVVFPLIAARRLDPARREQVLAYARADAAGVRAGTVPPDALVGPTEMERSGNASVLGVEEWKYALEADIGVWSEIIEAPGAFELVRVKERSASSTPATTSMRIGVYTYPYVDADDPRVAIGAALDRAKLVIVDPAWRDCVPTAWQHRLKANVP